MADESSDISAATPPKSPSDLAVSSSLKGYGLLRWTIRLTGLVLMVGGVVYLSLTACALLVGQYRSLDLPYILVISLIALGLGILALRVGFRMLLLVDAATIRQFSFIFALVYTVVLLHIMPFSGFFQSHLVFIFLLVGLYFGLSYWVINRILSACCFRRPKRRVTSF